MLFDFICYTIAAITVLVLVSDKGSRKPTPVAEPAQPAIEFTPNPEGFSHYATPAEAALVEAFWNRPKPIADVVVPFVRPVKMATVANLTCYKIRQLKLIAKECGIPYYSRYNSAGLIEKLSLQPADRLNAALQKVAV